MRVIVCGFSTLADSCFRSHLAPVITSQGAQSRVPTHVIYIKIATKGTTLTTKQSAFCAFVARGDTQTDAYIKAYETSGSNRKSASNEATKLCKMDKIKHRIQELKEENSVGRKEQDKLSKAWIIDSLRAEASDESNAPSVRVRALEILAKTEKLFDDSTSVNIVHRSSDEIYKELQEALSGFDLEMN